MAELIDTFRERDTRDELGIGVIRDAFADMLFPGTNTMQTRARYFLFVPWIYRRLEVHGYRSVDMPKRTRTDEVALIKALMAAGFAAVGCAERLFSVARKPGAMRHDRTRPCRSAAVRPRF